jgi:hypothetical protein
MGPEIVTVHCHIADIGADGDDRCLAAMYAVTRSPVFKRAFLKLF